MQKALLKAGGAPSSTVLRAALSCPLRFPSLAPQRALPAAEMANFFFIIFLFFIIFYYFFFHLLQCNSHCYVASRMCKA